MTELEVWKPVAEYEDLYMVSNYGRVKSLPKIVVYSNGKMYKYEEKVLKLNYSNGYRTVSFVKSKVKATQKVHGLVGNIFVPNPENKPFLNHLDGDRSNNYYKNLEWSTNSENQLHAYNVLGVKAVKGEQNGQSRLTESQVREIRGIRSTGTTYKCIAIRFGVCQEAIRKICLRRMWGWLPD